MAGAHAEPDLASLVGLRTVKAGHYAQYRGTEARLVRVMTALDGISRALVQTAQGPETLLVAVVETVRDHLGADWVLFALADGRLEQTSPRHLIATGDGRILAFEGASLADPAVGLPDEVLNRLNDVLRGEHPSLGSVAGPRDVHVPVELDGEVVGGLSAWTPPGRDVDPADLVVLRILASQATVALKNSALFLEAKRRAAELADRNAELERTQRELLAEQRTTLLHTERSRIARELHDSVGQSVLSAGLQIELCRGEVPGRAADHLEKAVVLTRDAMEQLRNAIYTLNESAPSPSIAATLEQLCELHMPPSIDSRVVVRGRVRELPGDIQHAVLRIAGESLFNAAVHACATRVVLTLAYTDEAIALRVDDDGTGDPEHLRAVLRTTGRGDFEAGRRRGLANMASRAAELGGVLRIRRSRIGGVRVAVTVPLDAAPHTGRAGEPADGTRPATTASGRTRPDGSGTIRRPAGDAAGRDRTRR